MAGASSGSSSRNAGLIRGCSAAALACLSIGVLVIAAGLILPSQIDRKLQAGVGSSACASACDWLLRRHVRSVNSNRGHVSCGRGRAGYTWIRTYSVRKQPVIASLNNRSPQALPHKLEHWLWEDLCSRAHVCKVSVHVV